MNHSSPTAILLNIGHAMDHWIIVVFAYSSGVLAGVWGPINFIQMLLNVCFRLTRLKQ